MPFAIGGNQLDTGYEVSNSLRFNDDDNPRLTREFAQEPTGNRKTFTISFWVKRSSLSSNHAVVSASTTSNFNDKLVGFRGDTNGIEVNNVASGSDAIQIITNRKFRDISAWYHIVVAIDTTQSSLADGVKLYVNGERDTNFDGTPVYNQNATFEIGRNGSTTAIGMMQVNSTQFFDGYLAEMHFIDGVQKDQTDFGKFNDNGVWIPKKYDGTYGNNGFYLEFKQTGFSANSSGIGADTSGNDNHFSISNLTEIDVTTDTCTNNFITMNPLATNSRGTFTQGNCEISTNVSGSSPFGQVEFGTFAVNKGKWYFEAKLISAGSGGKMGIGINERWETNKYTNGHNNIGSSGNAFYSNQGDIKVGTGSDQSASSYSNDDVIGVAFDLDNSKVYFHKEGVYQRSGDPANGTGGDTLTSTFNDYWTVWVTKDDTNHNTNVKFNFGNAPYSISSGNSDSEGFGNFEYAVPSGYFALCTKNLAEYG